MEQKEISRQEILRVLISVSDKSGIEDLSRALSDKGIEIISTGGTSRAISDAGISTNDIDYINAHATSTPLGDLAECNAVKSIFDSPPPISSTKSMTGHTLGAAGAVESIFSILSIVNNISPPTINLNNPDEGCDLDFIPKEARDMKIDVSLNNSFGFGGTNSTLIFKSV